ncbi:SAM-dependent methyltransferase [Actinocorallia longicatena]|uniref:SAM-dependent methyltransferase n=1 Tax=Actinocorallia longicatena TaxID=111803 RepID=A0ABP6QLZ0_9ACTN
MAENGPKGVDVSKPSVARIYDYALGGKDNYAVDRMVSDRVEKSMPESSGVAVLNRAMLRRAVRYLAGEAGIRQFLDLGSGLPARDNTHQVAERSGGEPHVVYVDNDPIVLTHGRALLAENDRTAVVTADLRDVGGVLGHPEVNRLIDFGRPVAILMSGILHHFSDQEDPAGIVKAYLDAVPPGSYLLVTHFHRGTPEAAELERKFVEAIGSGWFRTAEQILPFFCGLDLVAPGLVPVTRWRPDPAFDRELFADLPTRISDAGQPEEALTPIERLISGGVARKD